MEKKQVRDLREYVGLPIRLSDKGLEKEENIVSIKNEKTYTGKELQIVTLDEIEDDIKESVIYKVYEDVRAVEHKEMWKEVRFDIVVIWPRRLGKEYGKIIGYYRSIADNGYHYPEIYQVVEGYAEFLLQQPGEKHEKVKKVVTIRAQKQELIVIPPAYGVTIINPTTEKAVLSRIRARDAEEITKEYERTKGECYYRIEKGKWIPNKNYEELPMLRLEEPQNKWKIMKRGIPIYEAQIYNPKTTETLVYPDPTEFII
ncbi:MAG: glucose-6-phosphate isomerase family protein [Candidatus Heimdallarchaeaceae archaeon]